MASSDGSGKRRVCVTGAGGFAASWLVNLLLSKGFIVHGTVRDPSDPKNAHLKKLENSAENLQLFKADLLDYNAVASAIAGCEGVFHVASPVPSSSVPNPEVEVIEPAVTGTLNVLKASSEAKVKKVIYVSSVAAVVMFPDRPQDTIMDENYWSDGEYCQKTENFYCLSKTLAEKEALSYAEKYGLNVISVCPSTVFGPLLQQSVNSSSLMLINILKGVRETVANRMITNVDVRDLADALFLLYEKTEASGRYICSARNTKTKELVDILKSLYPNYTYPKNFEDAEDYYLTSDKLKRLGCEFRPLKETLTDSVESYKAAGLLDNN